jgi:hypothetical protein
MRWWKQGAIGLFCLVTAACGSMTKPGSTPPPKAQTTEADRKSQVTDPNTPQSVDNVRRTERD